MTARPARWRHVHPTYATDAAIWAVATDVLRAEPGSYQGQDYPLDAFTTPQIDHAINAIDANAYLPEALALELDDLLAAEVAGREMAR